MPTRGSVTRLIIDLRSDDPAVRDLAARLVWQRYFHELLILARSHLTARIRGREDEEDVIQSMYKSFCLRQRRGDFDLSSRDELWMLLVQITLRKTRNTANRHLQGRRDVRREVKERITSGDDRDARAAFIDRIDDDAPTPAEAALLNEALERRFQALREPELRQIAQRKLEGCSNQEIADELKCTVRTVERKLGRILRLLGSARRTERDPRRRVRPARHEAARLDRLAAEEDRRELDSQRRESCRGSHTTEQLTNGSPTCHRPRDRAGASTPPDPPFVRGENGAGPLVFIPPLRRGGQGGFSRVDATQTPIAPFQGMALGTVLVAEEDRHELPSQRRADLDRRGRRSLRARVDRRPPAAAHRGLPGRGGAGRRAQLLEELVRVERELRRAAGERPTPEEYQLRFPDDRDAIAAAFGLDERPEPKRAVGAAENMLLGLLALQNHFIDRDALVAGFDAWVADKSKPLGQLLLDRKALSPCAVCLARATGPRAHPAAWLRPRAEPGRAQGGSRGSGSTRTCRRPRLPVHRHVARRRDRRRRGCHRRLRRAVGSRRPRGAVPDRALPRSRRAGRGVSSRATSSSTGSWP